MIDRERERQIEREREREQGEMAEAGVGVWEKDDKDRDPFLWVKSEKGYREGKELEGQGQEPETQRRTRHRERERERQSGARVTPRVGGVALYFLSGSDMQARSARREREGQGREPPPHQRHIQLTLQNLACRSSPCFYLFLICLSLRRMGTKKGTLQA